ncbi:hypothetical protein BC833DRAFT_594160 [Globomyces pollinis-pini]|nr:hypothetical protein BC833DRAFT_594160 [Globomyces pollinis-pini]
MSDKIQKLQKLVHHIQPTMTTKIIELCTHLNLCIYCTQRYLGKRDFKKDYRDHILELPLVWNQIQHVMTKKQKLISKKYIRNDNGIEVNENEVKENENKVKEIKDEKDVDELQVVNELKNDTIVCPTCLGLLQLSHHQLTTEIIQKLESERYQLKSNKFNLSIQLPTQLTIRNQSMILWIKKSVAVEDLVQIPHAVEVKEIVKLLVKRKIEEMMKLVFEPKSDFTMNITFNHPETTSDYEFLTLIPNTKLKVTKKRKSGVVTLQGLSQEKVSKAVQSATFEDFERGQFCPPPMVKMGPIVEDISLQHSQIYIAGRYCKLKRHISNAAWVIGGKRLCEDSVEELIENFVTKKFRNTGFKFSSAGREDADVLMLGRGRPFYMELINPHHLNVSELEMWELQETINNQVDGKIKVNDLQIVSRESTSVLKDSASTKCKSYSCMIKLNKPVPLELLKKASEMKNLTVDQRNPTRVPRRADLVRVKTIEYMELIPQGIDDNQCTTQVLVNLKTSAGTYVKEFMHGDEGRTKPSLVDLLECETIEVIYLDVLEIFLDWPQQTSKPVVG